MITKKYTIFFVFLICLIGSWLFYVKYSVISIEDRIRKAKKEIAIEQKNQHILRAEWKSLTSPKRVQDLAQKHLKMRPIMPTQIRKFDLSLFHSEKSRHKKSKKLSKLIGEIFSERNLE